MPGPRPASACYRRSAGTIIGCSARSDLLNRFERVTDQTQIRRGAVMPGSRTMVDPRSAGPASRTSVWRCPAIYFGFIDRERDKLKFDPAETARVVGEAVANAPGALPEVGQDALVMIESMVVEFDDLTSAANVMVPSLNDAASMLRGMGKEAEAGSLTQLAQCMADATAQWQAGAITGEAYAGKLRAIATEAETTIGAMAEMDQVQLSGVIGQVKSLLGWVAALPGTVSEARGAIASLENLNLQGGFGPDLERFGNPYEDPSSGMTSSPRPRAAPALVDEGGIAAGGSHGGGGGGGGEAPALRRWWPSCRPNGNCWTNGMRKASIC